VLAIWLEKLNGQLPNEMFFCMRAPRLLQPHHSFYTILHPSTSTTLLCISQDAAAVQHQCLGDPQSLQHGSVFAGRPDYSQRHCLGLGLARLDLATCIPSCINTWQCMMYAQPCTLDGVLEQTYFRCKTPPDTFSDHSVRTT